VTGESLGLRHIRDAVECEMLPTSNYISGQRRTFLGEKNVPMPPEKDGRDVPRKKNDQCLALPKKEFG